MRPYRSYSRSDVQSRGRLRHPLEQRRGGEVQSQLQVGSPDRDNLFLSTRTGPIRPANTAFPNASLANENSRAPERSRFLSRFRLAIHQVIARRIRESQAIPKFVPFNLPAAEIKKLTRTALFLPAVRPAFTTRRAAIDPGSFR